MIRTLTTNRPERPDAPAFLARLMLATGLALGLFAGAARADITVNVNQGVSQPLPIAIPAFAGKDANTAKIGADTCRSLPAICSGRACSNPWTPTASSSAIWM